MTFEGKLDYKMKPGGIIPFFEHANLATSRSLDFLHHCLARKAIYHILECENDPVYRDGDKGYYRFATALFPLEIVEVLKTEINKLGEEQRTSLKKRFFIPDPKVLALSG